MKYNLPKFNVILIAICLVVIVIGFALMAGEPSGERYNPDIFSFRRITLAPIVTLLGFVGVIVAILFEPKKK
jgi:hypothetical protein